MKGVAIVLMVLHHAFGNPDWQLANISYPYLTPYIKAIAYFGGFAVVPMFVMLTGYTYYLHRDKSWSYSLKKIAVFFVDYWLVLFTVLVAAFYFCGYRPNPLKIVQEMFSITKDVMLFSWYILLYVEIMLFLPFLHHISCRFAPAKVASILAGIFAVGFLLQEAIKALGMRDTIIYEIVDHDFMSLMPLAIMGYYFAKYDFFTQMNACIGSSRRLYILSGLGFLLYQFVTKINFICTPLWILFLYKLHLDYSKPLRQLIIFLGRHSMNIWFFQCVFFAVATREFFQPIGFLPYYPPLVVLWILFLCTIASIIFTPIQKLFQPKVEALFK